MRADLHMHSDASDGELSPAVLMLKCREAEITCVALTDHDTLHGLSRAQEMAHKINLNFIPGLEVSADGEREVHLLIYGASASMAPLEELLNSFRDDRHQRMFRYLHRLQTLGMPLTPQDLNIPPGTAFSRPLLARAMVSKGYASSIAHGFEKFLARGRPAYISRLSVDAQQIISMARELGCVPVLAHPALTGYAHNETVRRAEDWVKAGLMGIEVYHPGMSRQQQTLWESFARDKELLITAGSDYHGAVTSTHAGLGSMCASWRQADIHLDRLLLHLARNA